MLKKETLPNNLTFEKSKAFYTEVRKLKRRNIKSKSLKGLSNPSGEIKKNIISKRIKQYKITVNLNQITFELFVFNDLASNSFRLNGSDKTISRLCSFEERNVYQSEHHIKAGHYIC